MCFFKVVEESLQVKCEPYLHSLPPPDPKTVFFLRIKREQLFCFASWIMFAIGGIIAGLFRQWPNNLI